MEDPLAPELHLATALRLTAPAPAAWVQAASAIPALLADLASIEQLAASESWFRPAFEADPDAALERAGFAVSVPLRDAVRERLGA
jgi:hypothetical protein